MIPNFLIPYTFPHVKGLTVPVPRSLIQQSILMEPCTIALHSAVGPSGSTLYCSPPVILNKPFPCWYQPVSFSLFSGSLF